MSSSSSSALPLYHHDQLSNHNDEYEYESSSTYDGPRGGFIAIAAVPTTTDVDTFTALSSFPTSFDVSAPPLRTMTSLGVAMAPLTPLDGDACVVGLGGAGGAGAGGASEHFPLHDLLPASIPTFPFDSSSSSSLASSTSTAPDESALFARPDSTLAFHRLHDQQHQPQPQQSHASPPDALTLSHLSQLPPSFPLLSFDTIDGQVATSSSSPPSVSYADALPTSFVHSSMDAWGAPATAVMHSSATSASSLPYEVYTTQSHRHLSHHHPSLASQSATAFSSPSSASAASLMPSPDLPSTVVTATRAISSTTTTLSAHHRGSISTLSLYSTDSTDSSSSSTDESTSSRSTSSGSTGSSSTSPGSTRSSSTTSSTCSTSTTSAIAALNSWPLFTDAQKRERHRETDHARRLREARAYARLIDIVLDRGDPLALEEATKDASEATTMTTTTTTTTTTTSRLPSKTKRGRPSGQQINRLDALAMATEQLMAMRRAMRSVRVELQAERQRTERQRAMQRQRTTSAREQEQGHPHKHDHNDTSSPDGFLQSHEQAFASRFVDALTSNDRSSTLLSSVFVNAGVMLCLVDFRTGILADANETFLRTFKWRREDVVGYSFLNDSTSLEFAFATGGFVSRFHFVTPEDEEWSDAAIRARFGDTAFSSPSTTVVLMPDGSACVVCRLARPLSCRNPDGTRRRLLPPTKVASPANFDAYRQFLNRQTSTMTKSLVFYTGEGRSAVFDTTSWLIDEANVPRSSPFSASVASSLAESEADVEVAKAAEAGWASTMMPRMMPQQQARKSSAIPRPPKYTVYASFPTSVRVAPVDEPPPAQVSC